MKKSKYLEEEEEKMSRTHSKLSEKNDFEEEDESGQEGEDEDEDGTIKQQDLIVKFSS